MANFKKIHGTIIIMVFVLLFTSCVKKKAQASNYSLTLKISRIDPNPESKVRSHYLIIKNNDNGNVISHEIDQSTGFFIEKDILLIFIPIESGSSHYRVKIYKIYNKSLKYIAETMTRNKYNNQSCQAKMQYEFTNVNKIIGHDVMKNLFFITYDGFMQSKNKNEKTIIKFCKEATIRNKKAIIKTHAFIGGPHMSANAQDEAAERIIDIFSKQKFNNVLKIKNGIYWEYIIFTDDPIGNNILLKKFDIPGEIPSGLIDCFIY